MSSTSASPYASPFYCWLAERGLNTLELRFMARAGECQGAGGASVRPRGWKANALPPANDDHPPSSSRRAFSEAKRLKLGIEDIDLLKREFAAAVAAVAKAKGGQYENKS